MSDMSDWDTRRYNKLKTDFNQFKNTCPSVCGSIFHATKNFAAWLSLINFQGEKSK